MFIVLKKNRSFQPGSVTSYISADCPITETETAPVTKMLRLLSIIGNFQNFSIFGVIVK